LSFDYIERYLYIKINKLSFKDMEILEIYHYDVNEQMKSVEITFRLNIDSDDESRVASFDFSVLEDYGIEVGDKIDDIIFESEDFVDEFGDDEFESSIFFDEDELISFLNEYFTINPKDLPEKTFF